MFLAPPSFQVLKKRLTIRQTEDRIDLDRRLETANEEMKQISMFDYVVVNKEGALDQTVDVLESIIQAERWRFPRRILSL